MRPEPGDAVRGTDLPDAGPARRTVLLGGIAAGGGLALAALGGSAPALAAVPIERASSVTETLEARVLDGGLTAFQVVEFPVAVQVVGIEAQRSRRIAVGYDPRVFVVYSAHVVRLSGKVERLAIETRARGPVVETSLTAAVGTGETAVVRIGVARVDGYPADGVADVASTDVRIDDVVIGSYLPGAPAVATAWGVEVYPIWSGVRIPVKGDDATYRYPVGARISSVGPAPSPDGLELDVSFDPQAISALSLSSSTSTSAGAAASSAHAAGDLLVVSLPSIPAGESLDLRFEPTASESLGTFATVRQGLVAVVVPPADGTTFVRSTGRYSVPDLTVSGNGTVLDVVEGRI